MSIEDTLNCGYYEDNGTDYVVEIKTKGIKEWIEQEGLDLLDFDINMEKKIALYNILEENLTQNLKQYTNFTVKFI